MSIYRDGTETEAREYADGGGWYNFEKTACRFPFIGGANGGTEAYRLYDVPYNPCTKLIAPNGTIVEEEIFPVDEGGLEAVLENYPISRETSSLSSIASQNSRPLRFRNGDGSQTLHIPGGGSLSATLRSLDGRLLARVPAALRNESGIDESEFRIARQCGPTLFIVENGKGPIYKTLLLPER